MQDLAAAVQQLGIEADTEQMAFKRQAEEIKNRLKQGPVGTAVSGGGRGAPPPANTGGGRVGNTGKIIVHASDGKDHPFDTEAEARTFEALVKANHGTTQRK